MKYYYYFFVGSIRNIISFVFFEWRRFGIKKNDIVVDFGCGGRPLPRANILVDKFISGVKERPTEFVDNGACIIECDLENLPFKDKSIDFSYSSHVIEHLENLDESLQEMQRVSKRGHITCPSAIREQIVALKMHLWFIEEKNSKLYIARKKRPYPEYIGSFFDKLITNKMSFYWHNFEKPFSKDFYVEYNWKDKINYEIKNEKETNRWKVEGETEFFSSENILLYIRKQILILSSRIIRSLFSNKFKIEDVLCCPICRKGGVLVNSEFVICNNCKKKFRHKDRRIFNFLNPESL